MIPELDMLRAWPGIRPEAVIPMNQGNNNLTYRVRSPQGEFILQVMLNVTDPACLASQHRLLGMLQELSPGFAVPTPLSSSDGSTIVGIDGESRRLCVLTQVIPGRHPDISDTGHIAAAAMALGRLHRAFAQIPEPARYTCGLRDDTFTTKSAPFAGPEAMIASLGLSASMTTDLVRVFTQSTATLDAMETFLPAQIIHSDYYPSNVLIDGRNVSGVLDFEVVSLGARAYDVALGLWAFVLWHVWRGDDTSAWRRAEVFLAAYASTVSLAPDEWRRLADYIVIQEAHSLLHWCRRFIGGLVSRSELEVRAQRLIDMDRWVERNRETLVALVSPWRSA
jgi:Ser/Thr protein kinase RdoA (MazF antagonist)